MGTLLLVLPLIRAATKRALIAAVLVTVTGGVAMAGPTSNGPGGASAASGTVNRQRAGQPSPAQRRRERDDLRRQDLAGELAGLGLVVQWQNHTLADLADWRDRIQAANALRAQHGVQVDWRFSSLENLTDMRLRAGKAAQLAIAYGVHVDWRRYTWQALEALRRQIGRLPADDPEAPLYPDDGLAMPGVTRRRLARSFRPHDPDAILAPTFAFETPLAWARASSQRGNTDPDAILVPRFVWVPPPRGGPDDMMDPGYVGKGQGLGMDPGAPAPLPAGRR